MAKPVGIRALRRDQLITALECVQHHCPPRPSRQDKETLVESVWAALKSDRYAAQMAGALKTVGYEHADGLIPPRDNNGNFIHR